METETKNDIIIQHNIRQAEEVLLRVSRSNKGAYAHELNSGEHKLRVIIKEVKARKPKTLDDPLFKKMCTLKQHVAATLYMTAQGI